MWPDPSVCSTCHDGTIRARVTWNAPRDTAPSNLRFAHNTHPDINGPGSTSCVSCHAQVGAPSGIAHRAEVQTCLNCHRIRESHLAADAACATCHIPLNQVARLTRDDVSRFPVPPSHRQPGFGSSGHGPLAKASLSSCATCHARDFCASCHVNAPENRTIQALAADPRSLGIVARISSPPSHKAVDFLEQHGGVARKKIAQCATCHTRESCVTCHATNPSVAASLPATGPGRAAGAYVVRRAPASHIATFRTRHQQAAEATPAACATCHARSECMECHRPSAAAAPGSYHARGFLERHPAAAYSRETTCTDCHNTQVFCTSCHATAGFKARTPIGAGYHDANRFFLLGHGPAARQGLESCVSCHAERDCLTCHSAQGGRRFNPHGSDFNANRLREKNPEMCTVCHGVNIPGAP
jgi:predicted CXXCH cytochrome family protein